MKKGIVRYLTLNCGLFALLLLVLLSITGAFLGANKASLFFNSPPLAVFWMALSVLFVSAFIFWKSLYLRPYLLLCHVGCIAVLAGGLWGSEAAHAFRMAAGLSSKLTQGTILLHQGQTGSQVTLDDQARVFELPFSVRLAETEAIYYDEPFIGIYDSRGGLIGRIPAAVGGSYELYPKSTIGVQVTRRFENLRLIRSVEGMEGVEGEASQSNPGYEVTFSMPDGSSFRRYVFERIEPHAMPNARLICRYSAGGMPKEYRSLLILEKAGQVLAQKTIRVNDPLHYGGYHFYQNTFGCDQTGPYSGIMVVSDSGVGIVFFGYALLIFGLFGQFWIKPLYGRRKQAGGGDAH